MASNDWLSTLILRLWFLIQRNPLTILVFLLQLIIEFLPLIEDLHKLIINLVTVELLKDIFLMLKLILWLFCLLGSLLFLYDSKSVLRLFCL